MRRTKAVRPAPPPQIADSDIFPFQIPFRCPAAVGAGGGASGRQAAELWSAAARVQLAVRLVDLIPTLVLDGYIISATAATAIAALVPEFGRLKMVLDHTAVWPTTARPGVTPPAGQTFPEAEYRALLAAIPRVIGRDATALEKAGAIPVRRTDRGRPYWDTISFDPPPRPPRLPAPAFAESGFGVPAAPPHPDTIRIQNPGRPGLRRLGEDARAFRVRLEADPEATMTALWAAGEGSPTGTRSRMSVSHADDFSSVNWFGQLHDFTRAQAKVVAELWRAAANGVSPVTKEEMVNASGSDGRELRDVFKHRGNKMHPAWGTMIVWPRRGKYQLAVPPGVTLSVPPQPDSGIAPG